MSRLLKWIGIVVAAALVLVLVLSAVLFYTVDEGALRDRLVAGAEQELDARLHIDGELKLNLLPTLQLAASDVRLTGPGDATDEIAAAQVLRFGAELWPLLRGRLSVTVLTLEGLRLHLHRGADGHANWESLQRKPAAPASTSEPPAGADAVSVTAPDLRIENVRIEDGSVDFRDERAGKRYQIQFLALRGEDVNLRGEPFRLDADGRLVVDEGKHDLQFGGGAQIRADLPGHSINLADANLRLARTGGAAIELRLPAIDIALDRKRLETQPFTLSADSLEGNGTIAFDWSDPAATRSNGALHLARLDLGALAPALGIELPGTLNPEPLAAMTLDATLAQIGPTLRMSDLHLHAGQFELSGELAVTNSEPVRIEAKLATPALDLDYLLPPPEIPPGDEEDEPANGAPAGPAATSKPPALSDQLQSMGTIEAAIGSFKRHGYELSDLKAVVTMKPGSVKLEQLNAGLYGGTLAGSGRLEARDDGKLALDAQLTDVDVRSLLAAAKQPERMSGRLDGTLALKATGTTPQEWIASLGGPLSIEVREPVIRELSVQKTVCTAVAALNKEMLSAEFPADTKLDKLATSLEFDTGVGKFSTLSATLPDMALAGKGRIDLPQRKLGVQLDARVTRDLANLDPACRMTRQMQKIVWPLTCKGSLDEPARQWCRIDDDDLAKIAAQLAGKKLKDKLKDKLDDFFRSH